MDMGSLDMVANIVSLRKDMHIAIIILGSDGKHCENSIPSFLICSLRDSGALSQPSIYDNVACFTKTSTVLRRVWGFVFFEQSRSHCAAERKQ